MDNARLAFVAGVINAALYLGLVTLAGLVWDVPVVVVAGIAAVGAATLSYAGQMADSWPARLVAHAGLLVSWSAGILAGAELLLVAVHR